jgi:hypothetical protein
MRELMEIGASVAGRPRARLAVDVAPERIDLAAHEMSAEMPAVPGVSRLRNERFADVGPDAPSEKDAALFAIKRPVHGRIAAQHASARYFAGADHAIYSRGS